MNRIIHGVFQFLFLVLIPVFIISCAAPEMKQPQEAAFAPRTITEDMTCPVCGMYPARYPKWQTEVIFRDGSFAAFDGSKDMFRFLLEMGKYDKKHTKDDVAAVYVKGFESGEWINAGDAYFIIGSNVPGAMGKELIPFGNHMEAMKFKEKHGGTMGRYSEITMETIISLGKHKMKMKHKMNGHEQMMKMKHK